MRWTHSGDWLWSLARAGKNGAGIIYVAGEIIHFEAGSSALARGQDASDDSGRCDDTVGSAGAGGSIFLRADKLYLDRSDQYSHFNARGGRGLHLGEAAEDQVSALHALCRHNRREHAYLELPRHHLAGLGRCAVTP